jgi:type 1 glutamine amidotransferase
MPLGKGKRVLFFTKSQGFPHSVVTRKPKADGTPGDELAFAEKLIKQWGEQAGYAVEVSKDGSIFTPEKIATFDAFMFYTTGVLTDPPRDAKADQTLAMSVEGKKALLEAIAGGKGFIGLHSATDTFENPAHKEQPPQLLKVGEEIDPYCAMIGAEFTSHGSQQKASIRVASRDLPGLEQLKDFTATEEWYAFTSMARDLHVILVQETPTMKVDASGQRERQYRSDPYPATWARMHGRGRVFYTGMGHREDIWTGPVYQSLVMAALAWATGVRGDPVKGNIAEACPWMVK